MSDPKRPEDLLRLTDEERDALDNGYIAMAGVPVGQATHTAGEWEVFDNRGNPGFADDDRTAELIGVTVAGRHDIAHCSGFSSSRTVDETLANARLIAAAPTMLAKLKQIAGECCNCDGRAELDGQPCENCKDVRDVIAKAEGKQ